MVLYDSARSVSDVQSAVERIFPLVYEFRKPRTPAEEEAARRRQARTAAPAAPPAPRRPEPGSAHLFTVSDDDDDDTDSWDWFLTLYLRLIRRTMFFLKQITFWHKSNTDRLL